MARLTNAPVVTRPFSDSLVDLDRVLSRLRQTILQADTEREKRLRTSEYERTKAEVNLEYARTLLTKLEHDALGIKVHTRRQETQADLSRHRDLYERIAERLRELEDISVDSDDDDHDDGEAGDSDDSEDLLGASGKIVIQTPSASTSEDSRSVSRHAPDDGGVGRGLAEDADEAADESTVLPEPRTRNTPPDFGTHTTSRVELPPPAQTQAPTPTPTAQPQTQPTETTTTTTSQNLRPRGAASTAQASTTTALDRGNTATRRELFGDRTAASPTRAVTTTATAAGTTATTEAILDHHRAEQDALTESLVRMAASLKQSSQAFSTSLESERGVLDAAGQGLARNESGLEAAARRMGALRRATEGRGWWGRVLLYAWIAGLAVLAILIVFVLPKLRF